MNNNPKSTETVAVTNTIKPRATATQTPQYSGTLQDRYNKRAKYKLSEWERNSVRKNRSTAMAGDCYIEDNYFPSSTAKTSEIIVNANSAKGKDREKYYQVCEDMLYAAVDPITEKEVQKVLKLVKSGKNGEIEIRSTVKVVVIRPNNINAGRMEIQFFSK